MSLLNQRNIPTLSFCCRRKLRALDSTTKSGVSWRLIVKTSLVNAWNLGELRVEHIGNIQWDKNVFKNNLVMDQGKKELIQALVTVHLKRKASTKADFMTGKGEGLLVLLHGGPGTEKHSQLRALPSSRRDLSTG
jgi:hypothetical protein